MSRIIAFDFETIELTDSGPVASTEAYRPNFRIDSMALAFPDRPSEFIRGEDKIRGRLEALINEGMGFISHNAQYEYLCCICRFPGLQLNWHADTMRLAQLFDNGGSDDAFEYIIDEENVLADGDMPTVKRKPISGLGLVVCTKRILGVESSHKGEAYGWLHEHHPQSKGKEGRFLHLLPEDIMARYNIADSETTLALYKHITEYFAHAGFDWTLDWQLFFSTLTHIAKTKQRGVEVDRPLLATNTAIVRSEIAVIEKAFLDKFATLITKLEYEKAIKWVLGVKTVKGQKKRLLQWYTGTNKPMIKAVKFNPGSNKQLAELFVGQLGIVPEFFTDKGAPSFKSAMLSQWGEGGEMLKTRRKRMLVLTQMESLKELSEFDGRWHVDLRACGTSTGRMAGGRS